MTYKARIYPKFWAHSKKFQIKRVQDHEYTIDFGERYWVIKVITYPRFWIEIQKSFSKVREPKIMSMLQALLKRC